ncbi:MAG: hypothetical protein CL840_03690 [Crocinitomicaceae bacterium]|nr:hypothetical protein [Crocinitomicaceae bacterium]|tara:strand:+ start:271362 stop:272012 length:651 start_codon:yes stop_codon:yes gene_type:complete
MFILKIILGLILAIAVGAIFTDNMGDGYFDFQKQAKAEAFTNKVDDVAAVMQTYKISQVDTVSLVENLEDDGIAVSMDNAVAELTSEEVKLLKGDAEVEIGDLSLATHVDAGQEGVYLVLVGTSPNDTKISDEICQKINENIRGEDYTAVEHEAQFGADLSALTATDGSAAYDGTDLFTAVAASGASDLIAGKVEGGCLLDTVGENNAFVYYVQEK